MGSTLQIQKSNSLQGRWFSKLLSTDLQLSEFQSREQQSSELLARNTIIVYNRGYFRILGIYTKSYNKWRLAKVGGKKSSTIIQAIKLQQQQFLNNSFESVSIEEENRYLTIKGTENFYIYNF